MTRDELITALKNARAQMETALAGLTDDQLQEPGVAGEWTIKDLLTHLTAWTAELITGLVKFKRGSKSVKTQYAQAEIDAQNAQWYAENKQRPVERVLGDHQGVHKQLLRQVEALNDRAVAGPSPWSKHSLAEWIMEWVVDHEREHAEQIAHWRKQRGW